MRYVPGPLQPPPDSSGVGVNLVVYAPTTSERPYALIVVVAETWPNNVHGGGGGSGRGGNGGGEGVGVGGRWSGAPRRSCHVGSREITFESGSVVLLLSLRDCQAASTNAPPRWPSDADLAAVRLCVFFLFCLLHFRSCAWFDYRSHLKALSYKSAIYFSSVKRANWSLKIRPS